MIGNQTETWELQLFNIDENAIKITVPRPIKRIALINKYS